MNLFISNFPLAGYRTLIEVMSLGVPIIIEKNLVSNYLSGEIIAPKVLNGKIMRILLNL